MSRLQERLLFVLAIALGAAYLYFLPEPAPAGVYTSAQPAPEVAHEETVPVPCTAPVQVYKPATKRKLPPAAQAPTQHVVASTLTANDERRHTVTTLLDTSTGRFKTYDRAEPHPWLAATSKSEIGVFYGLSDGQPAVSVQARREFLQIKALHVGVAGSADISPARVETFVGVGAWARW